MSSAIYRLYERPQASLSATDRVPRRRVPLRHEEAMGGSDVTEQVQQHVPQSEKSSSAHKATLALYDTEIKTARALLSMQQQETRHCQEHIALLNCEIDTLRALVEEKQTSVHEVNLLLQEKTERIAQYEQTFDQFRIDKRALSELETQNAQLLKRLKEKQRVVDQHLVKTRHLENHKDNAMLAEEIRTLKLAESQIALPIEIAQLEVKLDNARVLIDDLQERLRRSTAENELLLQRLQRTEEQAGDQLTRTMQSEFALLQQVDRRDDQIRQLEYSNDSLQEFAVKHEAMGKLLQRQLQSSRQETEKTQLVCGAVVDFAERDLMQAQRESQLLREENSRLHMEKQLLGELVTRASTSAEAFGRTFPSFKQSRKMLSQSPERRSPRTNSATATHLSASTRSSKSPMRLPLLSASKRSQITSSPLDFFAPDTDLSSEFGNLDGLWMDPQPEAKSDFAEFAAGSQWIEAENCRQSAVQRVLALSISLATAGHLRSFDLQHLGIRDQDIDRIVSEFRKLSFSKIELVNLSHNSLSSEGVFKLIAWISGMASDELRGRAQSLAIDLTRNQIEIDNERLTLLQRSLELQPDFSLAECVSSSDRTLLVYGHGLGLDRNTQSLLLRIDLNQQRDIPVSSSRHRKVNLQVHRPQSVQSATALPSPAKLPTEWPTTESLLSDIYPRDDIMRTSSSTINR